MPSNARSFTPADKTSKFDTELKLTCKEFLHLLFEFLSDEGHDQVGRVRSDEMRERGGEDARPVPNRAAALVDELQLLALLEREEVAEHETGVLLSIRHLRSFPGPLPPRQASL